jgi:hypothetical protein
MIRTTDRRRLSETMLDGLSSGRSRNRPCFSLAALAAFRVLDSSTRARIILITVQRKKRTILMVGRPQLVSLFAGAVSRPELRFTEWLVPRIMIAGALDSLVAWLVVAIMEHTCLSRYVWHIPLLFLALIVLFSSLQCRCRSPPNHGKGAGQRSGLGGSRRRVCFCRQTWLGAA